MRTILFYFFLQCSLVAFAQERCAMPSYAEDKLEGKDVLLKKTGTEKFSSEGIIRIPVVVHVLYNNSSQAISDAQIKSGIDALNRDFRRRNADSVNTPQRFKAVAADVQIEFQLATSDPYGRKTTGIVRKQISRNGWIADDKVKAASQGGDDPWDRSSYLNIWVVNLIGSAGYSSVPGSPAETDGVVISYAAFGTINTASPFELGRTAVHEVGHWLGLKHIWGDAQCGDDSIDDTPQQGFFTKGCPIDFRSSCSNGNMGDMYMNYMDYTNDACMNLFTIGQKTKMRSLFVSGGARTSLLDSKGLQEPTVQEAPLPVTTTLLYPNPANDKITVQVSSAMVGKQLCIFNAQGQLQQTETIKSSPQAISVAALKPGIYFAKGEGFLQKFIKL